MVEDLRRESEPLEGRLKLLRTTANWLIYSSVALGLALLIQLYTLVPSWLFFSVLAGWVLYLVVAIMAATGRGAAYPSALLLSILTLLVSLPQPEHYSLVGAGLTPASLTFIIGSAVQFATMVLITSYLLLKRKDSQKRRPV